MVPERCQGVEVVWHGVIGKEACHHLPQPLSLARDRIVHSALELLLDLPHLGSFTVASGPPKDQEAPLWHFTPRCRAAVPFRESWKQ